MIWQTTIIIITNINVSSFILLKDINVSSLYIHLYYLKTLMSPAHTYIISERLHLYPCEHRDTALALKLNVEGYPSFRKVTPASLCSQGYSFSLQNYILRDILHMQITGN